MSNLGWSALISDLYSSKERSKVMGQFSSIGGVGRIAGITIGGYFYNGGWGFRNGLLFFAASFVMFISTIPMFFAPEGGVSLDQEENKEAEIKEPNKENINSKLKLIFYIFIISLIFINFGRNSISVPYSQYLTLDSSFNVDSIMLSYITNTRSLAVLVIGIFIGTLSKKIGNASTLIFGTILAIMALLITALTSSLVLIFIGSFLLGTGQVIIYASSYSIASNLIPKSIRGKLFGLYNTTFFLSWGLAGTVISGPLIDMLIITGFKEIFSYQISFIVAAIVTGIGLLIFILLEATLRTNQEI
jgi:MFS family permease